MASATKLTPGAPSVANFNSAAILNDIVQQVLNLLVQLQLLILFRSPPQHSESESTRY